MADAKVERANAMLILLSRIGEMHGGFLVTGKIAREWLEVFRELGRERDDALLRGDKAEGAAAVMREALQELSFTSAARENNYVAGLVEAALASDAGKGFLSREQVREVVRTMEERNVVACSQRVDDIIDEVLRG